jgi:hypothetical protein
MRATCTLRHALHVRVRWAMGLDHRATVLIDHRRVNAGIVELDGSTYAGLALPFDITQLIWIEALLVGGAEVYRNSELDPELRVYPGEQRLRSRAIRATRVARIASACCVFVNKPTGI